MPGIRKLFDEFDYKKVTKCFYGKCHEALIGEWINWWLENTKGNRKRRIINPAIQANYYGKFSADILFCERDDRSKSYKAIGVAEVENNKDAYLDKLKSLNAYINAKGVNNKMKFPDLEFVLLSTRQVVDDEGYITDSHFSLYENLREKIREYSEKSEDVYWIYYQMKLKKHSDEFPDEAFDIDYVEDFDKFYYYYSFEDKSDYLIARNGKIIKDLSQ